MQLKFHRLNVLRCIRRKLSNNSLSDYELQHKTPPVIRSNPMPMALYGGRHTVTLMPGTGIGPELLEWVQEVFRHAGAPVDFECLNPDPNCDQDFENVITSIRRNGVAIKGNIETKNPHVAVRNIAIRNALDLYVYVLWCKSLPTVPSIHKDLDIVIIRQNIEGEYAMLEHQAVPGVVETLKVVTEFNTRRVARYAFEFAKKHNRKKVTVVHKANIMKLTDGSFLKISKEIAENYPEIKHDEMIVDNCSMQLVSKPQQFDILLTTNLYGNICSSILCGIAGGPGLYSGKNFSEHYAVFETGARCMGSILAGKDIANPIAMLNASVDMLYHLGHKCHAKFIEDSIYKTVVEDGIRTRDIGGDASTSDFVCHLIENIKDIVCVV